MSARPTSSRLPALGAILGLALVRLVTRRGGTPAHHGPARAEPHAEEPERKPSNAAPSSHEASREPGRGREATSPTEIPPGAGRTSSGASKLGFARQGGRQATSKRRLSTWAESF